jgi:osmotically-inducible protein OsmY
MNKRYLMWASIGVMLPSMALVGCSPKDQADSKSNAKDAVAEVRQDAKEMAADASKGIEQAKQSLSATAQEAKDAAKTASAKIGESVSDAVITTAVKTELAKDMELSALKINVATDNGRVTLNGTAPSKPAREHAMALASAVKGVVSVDNQVVVAAGKG